MAALSAAENPEYKGPTLADGVSGLLDRSGRD